MARIAVLLATVPHRSSGRSMREPMSARAIELALRVAGAEVVGLHLGRGEDPALSDFLGMGLTTLRVVELQPGQNRVVAACNALQTIEPTLVFGGEADEGSGMLPYRIASALDWPLIAQAADITAEGEGWRVDCAMAGGWRRVAQVKGPAIVCVGHAAPQPRLPAYGKAARGIVSISASTAGFCDDAKIEFRTGRRPGKLLQRPDAAGGQALLEAFMSMSDSKGSGARVLADVPPDEAADAILHWLGERGLAATMTEGAKL